MLRISFLIAGHTKFNPDLLFSRIAKTYNRCDVFFSTMELQAENDVVVNYANVTEFNSLSVARAFEHKILKAARDYGPP